MDTQVWWRILKRQIARPYTSLRFALEGLRRSETIAHVYDLYRPDIAAAKSHQEREQALAGLYGELDEPEDDMAEWETRRWNKLATRYHVQTPELPTGPRENSEHWRFSQWYDKWLLTEKGKAEIRTRIRDEKKWRRDRLVAWVTAIGAVVAAYVAIRKF